MPTSALGDSLLGWGEEKKDDFASAEEGWVGGWVYLSCVAFGARDAPARAAKAPRFVWGPGSLGH